MLLFWSERERERDTRDKGGIYLSKKWIQVIVT